MDAKIAEARKKCTIAMMDREYKPVVVWELNNAWPLDIPPPGAWDNQ